MVGVLKKSDPLEVAHPVDEGVTLYRWVHHDFRLKGLFVDGVLVGKVEGCWFVQLTFKSDVEVDDFILEHIGH